MGRSKSEKWRLIWPFFSILVVHGIAIFIFTRGFLLTRTELPHSSNCSDVNQSSCFRTSPGGNSTGGGCWTKPSVGRVVIIVFDALRFDFVAPSTFFQDKKPWMDKLQVMHKLAADPGSSSRIFKAIADPPTTSLQRLKGLTTGGLPTFIDVGNSFGAPAIIEDNLIQQLVKNGKRVVMMGDDTWLQLFPHHFDKSFPYPSFNVKDLDTVDNGCIQHLLPSLTEGDWDVLIAHFLGVDHAGHIFGVNTAPMIQKLEQYNNILEDVIDVLRNQSGPGDLHENTFLLVMGDHGQTLNGDHGGGSPEEVETSIFAKSFRRLSSSILTELDSSSCGLNMDGKQVCISTIEQIDFAATVSAMLGIPSPFGSIGRVNSQLYALAAGTWPEENAEVEGGESHAYKNWMLQYANVLCINAWQVKRYIDVYSASSVIGFSSADLLHVANLYSEAQLNWSKFIEAPSSPGENYDQSLLTLKIQIDAYLKYLDGVIDLARSKWTEFDLKLMGLGFSILLVSLLLQLVAIKKVNDFCGSSVISWHKQAPAALIFSLFVAVMRASSFLSNSYILEEGKVAMYFLGTLWILEVRYSISKKMLLEAALLIVLLYVLRVSMELGLSKQVATGSILDLSLLLGSTPDHPGWKYFIALVSTIAVISLGLILLKINARRSQWQFQEYLAMGNSFNFVLLAVHWDMESELLSVHIFHDYIQKDYIARLVYVIGSIQVVTLALGPFFIGEKMLDHQEHLSAKTISMVSAWIPTIILLSGRQGALIGVVILVAAWCITKLENLREGVKPDDVDAISFYSRPVTEWSLLAVSLFFCTGHWCAFDGLRYAAAFIGFDEFNLIRQAILLSIETFGFSHILPILGLPLLVSRRALNRKENPHILFAQLSQVFLMYGFITATAATFTVLCVTIHRRHLMVWGLFAPKFVFEALGLMLTDLLICLSALYYINPVEK